MRKLLIHLFHQVVLDPKTRRINEILFHKCEFTDEMCDMRRQRQTHSLECNLRISLTLRNAVHRGQLPENLDTTRAAVCIHAYIDGLLASGCWYRTVSSCIRKPSAGLMRAGHAALEPQPAQLSQNV
jgi:hypothetical protein